MGDLHLKVAPDAIKRKADEVSGLLSELRRDCEGLKTTVNASKGYWAGDAAENFRSFVNKADAGIQPVLERLSGKQDDLMKMAGIYQEKEKRISDFASALPTNIIE